MYHAAASITKIYLNKYFDCENDWATGFKSVNFEYIDHSFASEKAIRIPSFIRMTFHSLYLQELRFVAFGCCEILSEETTRIFYDSNYCL